MRPVFESRRKAMAIQARADVAGIPTYRVRTPLKSAIQILKRHRNMRFVDEPEGRPSSIVITTLAAHAYGQESTVAGALLSILDCMVFYVECGSGEWWIANSSDRRENFSDAWNDDPSRQVSFDHWLQTAQADFAAASRLGDATEFVDVLAPRTSRDLVEAAVARRRGATMSTVTFAARANRAMRRILDVPHWRPATWPTFRDGIADIVVTSAMRDGLRPQVFGSGEPLARGSEPLCDARTDVRRPFEVFWRLVNTGEAAKGARDLRGGFDVGDITPDVLTHEERAIFASSDDASMGSARSKWFSAAFPASISWVAAIGAICSNTLRARSSSAAALAWLWMCVGNSSGCMAATADSAAARSTCGDHLIAEQRLYDADADHQPARVEAGFSAVQYDVEDDLGGSVIADDDALDLLARHFAEQII